MTIGGPRQRPISHTLLPLYLAHSSSHILLGIYPAVLYLIKQQSGASYALLGGVFTAATLLYGLGAFPTGLLLNRVRPLVVVRLCLVVGVAATALIALAPSPPVMAAGLLLLGLAFSPYHTAANTLLSRASGNDARLTAHHGMFGSIGLAVAPAFGTVLAYVGGWRLPFAVGAVLTVIVLAFTLLLPSLPNPRDAHSDPGQSLGRTHVRALALVFAITICLGFIFRGFETYLPSLLMQRADVFSGSRLVQAGLLASLVYTAGFFGQWWAARLGHRHDVERVYTALLAAQTAVLVVVFVATQWSLVLVLLLFSFVHFTTQPIDNVLTGKYTSLSRRGVGYGLSFGLSFAVGSLAAVVGGVVADAAGGQLQWVYLMLAGVGVVAAACGLALAIVSGRIRTSAASGEPETFSMADGPFDVDLPG